MARFNNGWIKVWRKSWESDLSANINLWSLWHALILMATWKETKIVWEGKQRALPPGSVVFGVSEISEKWKISRSVIKKWLHYLHDTQRVVIESCPRGTLVTICNWDTYQSSEEDECPQRVHSVSTACPQRVHSEPLNEESKKEERRKKKKIPAVQDAQSAPNPVQAFIASYCEKWKLRYGVNPLISKADAGRSQRIVKTIGQAKIEDYLTEFFLSADWRTKNSQHSLTSLEQSLNAMKMRLEGAPLPFDSSVRPVTRAEQITAYNAEMIAKIKSGEV